MRNLPSTRSRRERPAKPALSRAAIVTAALELLHTQTLEKVTLRGVAAALDTGAASLYVYIRNTEDLHAAMLEALLEGVAASVPNTGPWDDRLVALLITYTEVLFAHPGLARMTLFTQPSGPHYFAVVERLLALLQEGGVTPMNAAWGVDVLLQVATATAAEQGARHTDDESGTAMSAMFLNIATADPTTYPHISALRDELLSGGPPRLNWQLRALIAGIRTASQPTHPHPGADA